MSQEIDRIRKLAKAFAAMESVTVAIYRKGDGTFGFTPLSDNIENIVEYITPY